MLGAVAAPFLIGALATPASDEGEAVFRFQDPAIVESSGLVVQGGRFVTINDSGDAGRVFTVDPSSGETVGVSHWAADPEDVEALAPAGASAVWVGDIGDNRSARESVQVARVPVGVGPRQVTPQVFDLIYPDGAVDAETLLVHPVSGRLFVAGKSLFGAALYAAPAKLADDRPNRLRVVGDVLPAATDGAFFSDGRHLVVRGYGQAVVYSFPDFEPVGELRLPDQQQGEGIAVADDNTVYVSSEGPRSPVLEVPLPADLARIVAPDSTPAAISPTATPSPTPPGSRDGEELPEGDPGSRDPWQWVMGGALFVVAVVAAVFAIRMPRRR